MNTENNKITHKFTVEEHCKLVNKEGDVQSLFVKQHVFEVSQEQIDNFITKAFQMGAEVLVKLIRNQGVGGEIPVSASMQQSDTEHVQNSAEKTRLEDFIKEMQPYMYSSLYLGLLACSERICYLEDVEKDELMRYSRIGNKAWKKFLSLRERYYEKRGQLSPPLTNHL